MKRYKNLYPQIYAFDNLLLAANNARKGKRYHSEVARFEFKREENLLKLEDELKTYIYQPGPYRSFYIDDPKRRMISAAPYRDRVVHHALMNITAPLFERTFIYDSYANREGKGTHAAILRYQHYARKFPYVLKCDIRKFFPSIDHHLLKEEIQWKIACPATLNLIKLVIDNSNQQEPHEVYFPGDNLFSPSTRSRGLPIGNLTSQWWGNIYLNRFDHLIKETLSVPGYIRYVDDFVLFDRSKDLLLQHLQAIRQALVRLRMCLHPHKTQIYSVQDGVPFLGFRVYPTHRLLLKPKVHRYRRFLRKQIQRRMADHLPPEALEAGLNSWLGHIRFAQSAGLEERIYRYIRTQGVNLVKHPNGSWRVLERNSNQLSFFVPQQEQSYQSEQ